MSIMTLEDLWVDLPLPEGPRPLVRGVSFRLEAGQVLGLMGLSGAGKTLTACALSGLLPPPLRAARGRLRLNGHALDLSRAGAWRKARGSQVLLLFQGAGAALNPLMRVGPQIEEALIAGPGLPRRQARERAAQALERFGLGARAARSHPHQLSGGMRRRVLLALAWALRPRVLIADEPTNGLDAASRDEMSQMFSQLTQELGAGLILISHDLRGLASWADHLAVMDQGEVVEQGPTAALLARPEHALTHSLVESLAFLEGAHV
ncbi:MAG: ABC transporter ATP-binding protein [Desulfarculaceae bacterium]|nr:ABC transporter ATP-binding protein [Desulfarculaceae bacterium]MCF8073223.1 ABC transporter ATP-binding protein [Desulfarculaceae bacterium]MCF8100819.1 ABC transporter ATP-binding protein [Desulfarculaceae bacterium]MCF8117743.1 ABC transporter ATP-binding protein [Desulfarculaceae bacterium]